MYTDISVIINNFWYKHTMYTVEFSEQVKFDSSYQRFWLQRPPRWLSQVILLPVRLCCQNRKVDTEKFFAWSSFIGKPIINDLIVTGDFNVNLVSAWTKSREQLKVMKAAGLSPLFSETIRENDLTGKDYVIDNIFSNSSLTLNKKLVSKYAIFYEWVSILIRTDSSKICLREKTEWEQPNSTKNFSLIWRLDQCTFKR